ncbi:MAG: flagellar hook capping protein [Dethiobacter sp.]|nr:flagellar hook capping protein [Dethiobacter sp.]MBS3902181.1 flagellar hook capping protein [Dethiobacter sp.]MBS3988604.1 flagellar hook capping protein [Dethiobacter sp.]
MTMIAAAGGAPTNSTAAQGSTGAMQTLGKDVFLKLLVTQLRYQDPLKPQDNSAFVAQMAQFTSLEQLQNVNATLTELVTMQSKDANDFIGNAPAYLGLNVTVASEDGKPVTGTVSAVEYEQGKPMLVIDGIRHGLEKLLSVRAESL